jgi:glycosyltransferase involved in cell wall biosynthesis
VNWLFLTPRRYYEGYSWLGRDVGLVCMGMLSNGVPASFGVFRAPGIPNFPPFLPLDPKDVSSPEWWKNRKFTHCFALTSARRAYEPMVSAARRAGVKIAIRMDSDGWQGPRQGFWRFFNDCWRLNADTGRRLPGIEAFLKTLAFRLFPVISDHVWLRQFEMANAICIESPIAAKRLKGYFRLWHREDLVSRVKIVPGPIPDSFSFDISVSKQNRVIAVGRWKYRQKNPRLLVHSITDFLRKHPDWSADIVGNGKNDLDHLLKNIPTLDLRDRIILHGRIPRENLASLNGSAKIALCTSFADGFPNALGEAVRSGCSIVGPTHIASMHYFTGKNSGTLFPSLEPGAVVSALATEAESWANGFRDPVAISTKFGYELAPAAVASTLLNALETAEPIANEQ